MSETQKYYAEDLVIDSWIVNDWIIERKEINSLKQVLNEEDWEHLEKLFNEKQKLAIGSRLRGATIAPWVLDSLSAMEFLSDSDCINDSKFLENFSNACKKHLA